MRVIIIMPPAMMTMIATARATGLFGQSRNSNFKRLFGFFDRQRHCRIITGSAEYGFCFQCYPLCNALLLPVALAPPPSKFRDVDSRPAHEQPIPILQQQRRLSEPFSRAVPTQALHKVHS